MPRSWLFAPGHSERFLVRAFEVGADEPLLDLEDSVAADQKSVAREQVACALRLRPAWVRVNRAGTEDCEADLRAVGGMAKGIRIPKVESSADISWVQERLGGRELPVTATIETAAGLAGLPEICRAPGLTDLAFGHADLSLDLNVDPMDYEALLFARSHLVVQSRANNLRPPSDGPYLRYADQDGLRESATRSRRLGFGGMSALHPSQVATINEVFSPTPAEIRHAQRVVEAYTRAGGSATGLDGGEIVDEPLYLRARRTLDQVGMLSAAVTEVKR